MFKNKKGKQNHKSNFLPFFYGKKGMEMWQLVMIILFLIFLLVVIVWFGVLSGDAGGLLDKLGGLL
ncbi:MAG: hypothetical protein ABH824_03940 [Nanoarchaeota archaeon]|nr:hypothetical protein [Nanoarchaeota archaeon]MBU1632563.1 hypothetical protein [Nanoarchaeota archaeon]MBU1876582.1 hypothetical protein [Nanoarchaeota archaeon]